MWERLCNCSIIVTFALFVWHGGVAASSGTLEKRWAADDNHQATQLLEEIQNKLVAADRALWASMAPLAAKMERTSALAETAIHTISGSQRLTTH